MASLGKELVALIIQFLKEEKLMDTMHMLEQESSIFFNMNYLEEKVLAGEWDEVEKYLSGFSNVHDNSFSLKIFFEIRKQKYLEALDRNDKARAVEILMKDLREFSDYDKDLFNKLTNLLTLKNIRENKDLSNYTDTRFVRNLLVLELKRLLKANPLIRDKLNYPLLEASRLRTLINQSLNWQHQLSKTSNEPIAIPSSHSPVAVAHAEPFTPVPDIARVNALERWLANAKSSTTSQSFVATSSLIPGSSNQGGFTLENSFRSMYSRTPTPLRFKETQNIEDMVFASQQSFPFAVFCTLYMKSTPTSMDFHPSLHSLLAVGCANGGVSLWEIRRRERVIFKPLKIWNLSACSHIFQAATMEGSFISVTRVIWCPKGDFLGVAFKKHLIQLYVYKAPKDLQQHLEIDAHVGSVNDLAFSYANDQLCIVTCGDDKLIKVRNLSGEMLFNFQGHEAAVYSVCPHQKGHVQFILSNDVDGKIKIWLYGENTPMVDCDAPGQWCTNMRYSADGSRLFSCGTSKHGYSFLVEWNESEGTIKTTYFGLIKKSAGVVQFDVAENRFLAVGEDRQIKFWDMDDINVLTTTYADGALPSLPLLKFNKKGNLLAVTMQDNGLRILGNRDGSMYLTALKT